MRTKINMIPEEIWRVTGTPKNGVCEMEIVGKDEVIIKLKKRAGTVKPKSTAIIKPDNGEFMAYCPELDLVTAQKNEEAAFDGLVEMAREYAKEYEKNLELYLRSSNRAHHYDYIKLINERRSVRETEGLFIKV